MAQSISHFHTLLKEDITAKKPSTKGFDGGIVQLAELCHADWFNQSGQKLLFRAALGFGSAGGIAFELTLFAVGFHFAMVCIHIAVLLCRHG